MIGILTFSNTLNYGACLQEYALYKSIVNLGYQCEIIDYRNYDVTKREKVVTFSNINSKKDFVKFITESYFKRKKRDKFHSFENDYLQLSKEVYTNDFIGSLEDNYNKIIVGSDQVWNLELTGKDFHFYLDFVHDNHKKNSYAASFGNHNISKNDAKKIIKYLKTFNTINVREKDSIPFLKKLDESLNINQVLDPTFLLKKDEWIRNMHIIENKDNYILLYFLHDYKKMMNFAKKLAQKEKCKIIFVSSSIKPIRGVKKIHAASIEEFVSLIANAKYVVTGSFHGVAMSINLNTQFFYYNVKNKSRIHSIINDLGIEERSIDEIQLNNIKKIDFDNVNEKLKIKRNDSILSLKNIIE